MVMRALRLAGVVAAGLIAGACATAPPIVEQTTRGPIAQEMQIARSFAANGRDMGWDEKRHYEEQLEEKVFKYLREHPDLQNETRYSTFRFWRQVSVGSTREEVKVLLDDPDERTIDPALMAALARRHWSQVQGKAKEAWVYPLGWVLYVDDKAVVSMIRARGQWAKDDDQ
jgi:hypothetical protein